MRGGAFRLRPVPPRVRSNLGRERGSAHSIDLGGARRAIGGDSSGARSRERRLGGARGGERLAWPDDAPTATAAVLVGASDP